MVSPGKRVFAICVVVVVDRHCRRRRGTAAKIYLHTKKGCGYVRGITISEDCVYNLFGSKRDS